MSKTTHDDHRLRVGVIVHTEKTLGAGLEELRAVLAALGHADPPWCEIDKSSKAPKQVRKLVDDGIERKVEGLHVMEYGVPEGCVAGYYPECNPLIPLWHYD